ncbi:DUF4381 domain-containing protein [Rubritalea marina]|uniref:DUF4381 domain-containing protein n=1 Tax=Rubritalea marina TaxID=361055 RepID=UPI000360A72C|nr:DUF4381 domain-containing protein [Rubritalea marina]
MDAGDINELRDIAVPEAPAIFPMASGLVLILVCIVWLLLCAGWYVCLKRRASAYRRAGVTLLGQSRSTREVSAVLKRVAMVSHGREAVASLYGAAWVEYLQGTCAGVELLPLAEAGDQEISEQLRREAAKWIQKHR